MSSRRNIIVTVGAAVSVSLIASALAVMLVLGREGRRQFELLNTICAETAEQEPETREIIAAVLKEYTRRQQGSLSYETARDNSSGQADREQEDILAALGYGVSDFAGPAYGQEVFFAFAGILTGILLLFLTFLYRNQKESLRIQALTDYLEQVPMGKAPVLAASGEDEFSKLEDAIYKNVTYLYQTKDAAVQAKNEFAENLSNIAHQIKTPITAMSLSVQMMRQEGRGNYSGQIGGQECKENNSEQAESQKRSKGDFSEQAESQKRSKEGLSEQTDKPEMGREHLEQVEKQILRLTHLQDALLVLSRLDAGALVLRRKEVDVFTLLVLAADNLQELFAETGTSIDIPELQEMAIAADPDWTMEAVMNLMKNCMEHNRGGTVRCSYGQNPLYTEILIWDEGEGFAKEDLPHLFERFYRGKNAGEGGIGIGLALSKELIERQNGIIRARNIPGGGACFEIRFYSH